MNHRQKIEAWNIVAKAANQAKDDYKKCIEALEELGDDIKDIDLTRLKKCLRKTPNTCARKMSLLYNDITS